jgi:maltose O-acetyltransferase
VGEQKERMLRGERYRYDDPDLEADHVRAQLLLERFNATSVTDAAERRELLEELLGHIGDQVEIKPRFLCDYGTYTSVGAGTFVNYGAVFLDCAPITIGRDVQIATNVQLLTPTHPLEAQPRRAGWESAHPIVLGDGVWLGGGVIVGPGVTVGENTVVGAGSVVVRDLPAGVLAVGNPCRAIRELG